MSRALFVVLLLFALAPASAADEAKPSTAILLVARADLPDANFSDSVVLVMNNLGPAPAGLILNRPTRIAVAELFPDHERLANSSDKVYFGGPVDVTTVSFLFRADAAPEHAIPVFEGVYVSTDLELLRTLLDRDKPMEGLRIFIGYSGWTAGQLEGEVAHGDWKLAPADAGAIFEHKSEHPWPSTPGSAAGQSI